LLEKYNWFRQTRDKEKYENGGNQN